MAETVQKPSTEVAANQERVGSSDRPENTFKENVVYSDELTKELHGFFDQNEIPLSERCRVNVRISKDFQGELEKAKNEIIQNRKHSESNSVQVEPTFSEVVEHINKQRSDLNQKVKDENAKIASNNIDKPLEKIVPPVTGMLYKGGLAAGTQDGQNLYFEQVYKSSVPGEGVAGGMDAQKLADAKKAGVSGLTGGLEFARDQSDFVITLDPIRGDDVEPSLRAEALATRMTLEMMKQSGSTAEIVAWSYGAMTDMRPIESGFQMVADRYQIVLNNMSESERDEYKLAVPLMSNPALRERLSEDELSKYKSMITKLKDLAGESTADQTKIGKSATEVPLGLLGADVPFRDLKEFKAFMAARADVKVTYGGAIYDARELTTPVPIKLQGRLRSLGDLINRTIGKGLRDIVMSTANMDSDQRQKVAENPAVRAFMSAILGVKDRKDATMIVARAAQMARLAGVRSLESVLTSYKLAQTQMREMAGKHGAIVVVQSDDGQHVNEGGVGRALSVCFGEKIDPADTNKVIVVQENSGKEAEMKVISKDGGEQIVKMGGRALHDAVKEGSLPFAQEIHQLNQEGKDVNIPGQNRYTIISAG